MGVQMHRTGSPLQLVLEHHSVFYHRVQQVSQNLAERVRQRDHLREQVDKCTKDITKGVNDIKKGEQAVVKGGKKNRGWLDRCWR